MNIVFVMMVFTAQSNWVPTLEFATEQKCLIAAESIKKAANEKMFMGISQKPFCVRIEK